MAAGLVHRLVCVVVQLNHIAQLNAQLVVPRHLGLQPGKLGLSSLDRLAYRADLLADRCARLLGLPLLFAQPGRRVQLRLERLQLGG